MQIAIIWLVTVVLIYIALVLNMYVTEKWWRNFMVELYGPKDFGDSLIRCAFTLGLEFPPKRKN